MNKKYLLLILFVFGCSISVVNAQELASANPRTGFIRLQEAVKKAVKKVYSASVLIWEFDTLQNSQMSAQFSGIVVSADGEVLSAAHVTAPGKTYQVTFPDGRQCIARGLGRIAVPPTFMLPDAAMLKIIETGPWPFADMGRSSSLKVNEPCLSIAYPESLEQRKPDVRFGRIVKLKNKYGFMESTCVMEPGDSGGPLFDLSGRLIGIHSGIEKSENINYEIPVDTYLKYRTSLMRPENYNALPVDTDAIQKAAPENEAALTGSIDSFFQLLNKQLKHTCVTISSTIGDKTLTIGGTVFTLEGIPVKDSYRGKDIILSKNSMIGENPMIMLPDGKVVNARIVKRDRVTDLILLLPVIRTGNGIKLQTSSSPDFDIADLGEFLVSIRPDSIWRTSVLGCAGIKLPKVTSYGYLGAVARRKQELLLLSFIQPGSAAEAAGMEVGDRLVTVDGKIVNDGLDVLKALQEFRAGDTTIIVIVHKGETIIKKVTLQYPPSKVTDHPADHFSGGKSVRRDGYENVFVHDGRIRAAECGGPVFDTAGNFRAINIARLSRTSTIAISARAARDFIIEALTDHEKVN